MRREWPAVCRRKSPWSIVFAVAWAFGTADAGRARADGTTVAAPGKGDAAAIERSMSLEGIPFEGLGLEGFEGVGSIASELRRMQDEKVVEEAWGIAMAVSGPGGSLRSRLAGDSTVPPPLRAMMERSLSGLEFSAGVDADPGTIKDGPSRWIGGVKVATAGSVGRAELALRTSVRYVEASRLIGLELGPRFERDLPGGLTFFIDGKAEAETGGNGQQTVMPTSTLDGFGGMGFGSIGVVGRTGIVR